MVQLYHNRNVNKNSLLFKVDYTSYELSKLIPEEFKGRMPTIEEIETELNE